MKTHVKTASLFLALCLFLLLSAGVLPVSVSAAVQTITKTVNIAAANKNESGPGYYWANRYDTLTLSGMRVETDEPYGLRLPKDCTVILEGDNYVKSAKYGLSCAGTVIFKGTGSLTIDAGEIGIYLITQDRTQKIRLIEGTYSVTGGKYGVYSDAADFSFVGKSMKISSGGKAILGRCVNLLGGSFTADSPVEATQSLIVNGVSVDIEASSPALVSKNLEIKNIDFSGSEYGGENSVHGKGLAKFHAKSVLLGDSVPGWVDYILLALAVLGVGALIFVPALRKKKKTKELYERLEKEGYRKSGN
ncbi:MAG: hypothetical protein E7576_06490 [Ruminococcaceae bacterium]|jgi:hypothetical protein|nr:hypothetical protein [Oscillospiraceae bacterium]